jgi:hypothetical protein
MAYTFDGEKLRVMCLSPAKEGLLTENETIITAENVTKVKRELERVREVDVVKFELYLKLIDIILLSDINSESSDIDAMLSEAPFGYRVAFETLEALGIIKYIE